MDMSDPRVPLVLAHAEACREAYRHGESRPPLPYELKDLSGIDLNGASLYYANLGGANLTNANFWQADLEGADLSGTNLYTAILYKANLWRANLRDADLSGVDLTLVDLGFADLTDAKITQDQLNSAKYIDVAEDGYPKRVAEKVILLHEPEADRESRVAKKRLVVELRADGKLHIKTPIFKY